MWCNLLKPRVVEMHKNNSDTLSEISESGTATSGWTSNWDAREELKDFVTKIGLKDVADLYQDRFRVDRKKLEQMLTGDNDALIPADVFFAEIMEDTDTYITWPNKLKLGAKSKKDPHVRIAGRPEDVQTAKERILTLLGTRCNRVTMKMDVSYTDHSHIIGKGGRSIKRVMEETQCHVHFPDSNRSNQTEKSNQVSISGDIEGVECARSRVRGLIPLIFGFELPIMSQNVDTNSPYVVNIQEQYKVQVIFKTRPKLHASLVLVKGVEWEVEQVKKATLLLMEYMCEQLANQIPVQMTMEISPHHHQTVLGKNHANLKTIMQFTSCQVMFPDAQDPNIPSLKKSNINITGIIHNVYKARQLLMGSLPLIIIFDLPEDTTFLKIKPDQIAEIQLLCDVIINFRQKVKQNTKACVIKGIERQASNIYRARNLILGLEEAPISADIPSGYHLPTSAPSSPFSLGDLLPTPTNAPNNPMSPLISPLMNWNYSGSPLPQTPSPYLGLPVQTQTTTAPMQQFTFNVPASTSLQQSMSSSGYHSMANFSKSNLDPSNTSISNNSLSPVHSPKNNGSPGCYRNFSESASDISSVLSEQSLSAYHGLPLDNKPSNDRYNLIDYDNKRMAGLRAMQTRPSPNQFRVPNNSWSGYGISHTSPGGMLLVDKNTPKKDEDIWKPKQPECSLNLTPTGVTAASHNTSNLADQIPFHVLYRVTSSNWTDLPTMLTSLGLERYIHIFESHEIDLGTFATFTDQDLVQIGITAFGARRKLLLAVCEINKRLRPFLMAPGAERRSSSSSNSTLSQCSPKEVW